MKYERVTTAWAFSFHRSTRCGLRRDDGSHRRLQVHRDNRYDQALNRFDGKCPAVPAVDFPRDSEAEFEAKQEVENVRIEVRACK